MEKNPTSRLISALKETGKNQTEIANTVSVSESTVSRWFSGETTHISEAKRKYIANAIGINVHYVEKGAQTPFDSANEPKVVYADEVDLPEDGKISRDDMKELLRQIESIARILKDSL